MGGQNLLEYLDRNNVFVVIIYAPPCDMVNNLISQKNEGDARGVWAFRAYGGMYIKTNTKKKYIDVVNRKDFINCLTKMNYEFESKDKLINFAYDIFKDMDITDDNDHYIIPKDYYDYDYIINVHSKTFDEIVDEILDVKVY